LSANKRPTINDVAKLAGVSITTVSRVINDNYPVSALTKKKVNIVIEELGFRPNLLARSLIQDKTQTIGIITPSIENLFFSEVIKGIDTYVGDKDYRSFLCNTEGEPEKEVAMIDSLLNRSVDGIIVIDPRTKNIKSGYYEGISKRLPLVLINGHNEDVMCNFVLNDDINGTLTALKYLKEQGRKRIALLLGRKSYSYDLKETIYRNFHKTEGIRFDETRILRIKGGNSLAAANQAKECVMKYLQESGLRGSEKSRDILPSNVLSDNILPCDAILCANDFMAIGALNGTRELGITVPKDLRIIGFDNSLVSQISYPTLSTVDHHMSELGRTAAKRMVMLIDADDFKDDIQKLRVDTNLIIRET